MVELNQDCTVSKFVSLIAGLHMSHQEVKLGPDEENILLKFMQNTGFIITSVAFGRLKGNYLDQDGSRTGETYPINGTCPYKVLAYDGDHYDHCGATSWLDYAWRLVVRGCRDNKDVATVTEELQKEVERSFPLNPIIVTDIGDAIEEYPPQRSGFVTHSRDKDDLSTCIHKICRGWIDRKKTTPTHDTLVCRLCHLRISFLNTIKTYGELREHFSLYNNT